VVEESVERRVDKDKLGVGPGMGGRKMSVDEGEGAGGRVCVG